MLVNVGDDALLGWIDPLAFVVEAGAGADGVDDFVSGGDDAFGFFDDEFEGADGVAAALGVEAGGLDVAVDGGGVERGVFAGDACGAVPVEVIVFDGFAVGAAADGAAEAVVGEVGAGALAAFAGRGGLRRERRGFVGRDAIVVAGVGCRLPVFVRFPMLLPWWGGILPRLTLTQFWVIIKSVHTW